MKSQGQLGFWVEIELKMRHPCKLSLPLSASDEGLCKHDQVCRVPGHSEKRLRINGTDARDLGWDDGYLIRHHVSRTHKVAETTHQRESSMPSGALPIQSFVGARNVPGMPLPGDRVILET